MDLDKEFKDLLKVKQQKLNDWYESYEAMKKMALPALFVVLMSCYSNALAFNYWYSFEGLNYKMTKITLLATIYGIFLCAYTITYLFDIDRKSIETSFFRVEKYRLRVLRYAVLILTAAAFAVNINSQTKALALAMVVTLAIFTFSIIMVTLKPKNLFYPLLTTIGSVSIELFVVIHFLFFFSKWMDISILWKIALFLYSVFAFFISRPGHKNKINLIQEYGLKFIDNNDLAELYKSKRQKLQDQLKAQEIIEIINGEEYGVRLAVESDLNEKNKANKAYQKLYKVFQALGLIFMFFFDPIKEGLIQYLTIDRIIKYMCVNFSVFCE